MVHMYVVRGGVNFFTLAGGQGLWGVMKLREAVKGDCS